jgi:hypothetical protein
MSEPCSTSRASLSASLICSVQITLQVQAAISYGVRLTFAVFANLTG